MTYFDFDFIVINTKITLLIFYIYIFFICQFFNVTVKLDKNSELVLSKSFSF